MRWLAAAVMVVVVVVGACTRQGQEGGTRGVAVMQAAEAQREERRDVRTTFTELYSEDPEEQAASDVLKLPRDAMRDRDGLRGLAEEILGMPVQDAHVASTAMGLPVVVAARTGEGYEDRPQLVFSYASGRLLSVDTMRRPERGGYMNSDARLVGDELIEKCFPKIPALLHFQSEERVDGTWVISWVGGVGQVKSGDVASVRTSSETGRLIWYRQWVAPLRPDAEQFLGDGDAFTQRGRDEVARHGLDPESFNWWRTLVLSWAEHPQAGPVWVVTARRERPQTWVEHDGKEEERINLIYDAHTGELLVAREREWWDFDPVRAEAMLVDAGVMPGRPGGR
ncbi:MAG: hypothetical protein AB7Y46_10720 [Armatimonadota bacterium]